MGFKLMDFADMDTIVDVVLDDNIHAEAEPQRGGYWEVDCVGDLTVDLEKIAEALGRPFDEKDFLQWVASYYGRISVEDGKVFLRNQLLGIGDYEADAAFPEP